MKISCVTKENASFISLVGQFWNMDDIKAFERVIDTCIREKKIRVVVDIDRLSFINSMGLGQLVKAHKNLTGEGGEIIIFRPRSSVLDVIEISGFRMFMPIAKDENELNSLLGSEKP